ncbi:MAG: POTRA domain-containing protein, partial [Verrucomicrobiota bacterium]
MLTLPISKPSKVCGIARFAAFLSLVLVALVGGLKAQDFEGKKIANVEIRFTGSKTVDEARLRNLMSSKAGSTYAAERLNADVKALYESGLVEEVRFLAEAVGDGLRLIAEVSTRAEYVAIGFVGNSAYSDKKLAKESKLKSRGILSDEVIREARRNIEKFYQGSGFPDVVVTHKIQATAQQGKADLVFVIDEGSKNEVRKIRFEGNKVFTTAELRKEMKTQPKGWFSWLTKSGRFESNQLDT